MTFSYTIQSQNFKEIVKTIEGLDKEDIPYSISSHRGRKTLPFRDGEWDRKHEPDGLGWIHEIKLYCVDDTLFPKFEKFIK